MKDYTGFLAEIAAYFLSGTFLLGILSDPRIHGSFSARITVAITYSGYAFLAFGVLLGLASVPYVYEKTKYLRRNLLYFGAFPLLLVSLSAIVATGLDLSPWLTVVFFIVLCFSFIVYSLKATAHEFKQQLKSFVGIGKLLVFSGIPLLWMRFVGWLFNIILPQERFLLPVGVSLIGIGIFLAVFGVIRTKKNNLGERTPVGSSNILVDQPINTASQDRLNRTAFANHFAGTLILHDKPSCLIAALYGPWGSGKSSLLNLIENYIQAQPVPQNHIVVRFNPWNITSLDQLLAMFFHELKVGIQSRKTNKRDEDTTVELLEVLEGILSVGQLSPVGNQYFTMGIEATKRIRGRVKDARNKSLADLKKELNVNLNKITKRIFVIIDDIDRLDAGAMKLLFRMIRLNADFENTTYLLAFDHEIVEKVLDDEQPKHGKEYLEKIIQLPVHLPSIDEALIISILTEELDRLVQNTKKTLSTMLFGGT